MATIDQLKWRTITRAINEIKNPASFLKNMLFSDTDLLNTFTAELSFWRRGRKVAPFVRRGAAGILVEGHSEDFSSVSLPHIRIKRPMNPTDLLEKRRPDTTIYASDAEMNAAIKKYMARELKNMDDDISNSEEYLAAMALRMQVSYVSADEEAFSVTYPRSATHNVALTGTALWTNGASAPTDQFQTVAELLQDDAGLDATDVILGKNAANAFVKNAAVIASLSTQVKINNGSGLDLTQGVRQNGAQFIGRYGANNIRVWRYARTLQLPDGTTFDLIRPDYAEFVAVDPAAEWLTYYGPHADMKAIGEGKVLKSKRFSKVWETEDPSVRWMLTTSNPLPVPRRPDASMSIKVV